MPSAVPSGRQTRSRHPNINIIIVDQGFSLITPIAAIIPKKANIKRNAPITAHITYCMFELINVLEKKPLLNSTA